MNIPCLALKSLLHFDCIFILCADLYDAYQHLPCFLKFAEIFAMTSLFYVVCSLSNQRLFLLIYLSIFHPIYTWLILDSISDSWPITWLIMIFYTTIISLLNINIFLCNIYFILSRKNSHTYFSTFLISIMD